MTAEEASAGWSPIPSPSGAPQPPTVDIATEANTETRRVEKPVAGETVDRSVLLGLRAQADSPLPPVTASPTAPPPINPTPAPPAPPARALPVGQVPAVPASLGARFVACLLDALVLIVPGMVLGLLLQISGVDTDGYGYSDSLSPVEFVFLILALAWYLLVIVYPIWGWARGQTLGMRAMHIRLVGENDMRSVGFGPAIVRWLMLVLMGMPCYLGYLSILLDRSGYYRGWNDQVARTRMIQGDLDHGLFWQSSLGH